MSTRVTMQAFYNQTMRYLTWRQTEIFRYNQQLSSGQRINSPSDDPVGSITTQFAQRGLSEVAQYASNLDSARDWLQSSESNIRSMDDIMAQVKERAEQMSTGTYTGAQRGAIAVDAQNFLETLMSLANAKLAGEYLFSGSRSDLAAVSSQLIAQNPAVLVGAGAEGHDVQAGMVATSSGVALSLTRLSLSSNAIVAANPPNTLGANLIPPLNFDAWQSQSSPGASSLSSLVSAQSVASATSSVSNRVGETLSWMGDSVAGVQTYRTHATLDITGPCSITIDGDAYATLLNPPDGARELVNDINANLAVEDYYAVLDSPGVIRILAKDTAGAMEIVDVGGSGVTIDQDTTLQELVDDINLGLQAQGAIRLDTAGLPDPANATHNVTLGSYDWTWEEIVGNPATVPATSRAYADALAAHINDNTSEFKAEVVAQGNTAVVQVTALTSGAAGNVALTVNGGASVASGELYGGLDATQPGGQGKIFGTGEYTGTLSRVITLDVTGVDNSTGQATDISYSYVDDLGRTITGQVEMPGFGTGNAVDLGDGVKIYLGNTSFVAGESYTLTIGRHTGNQEDLYVNLSRENRMSYNFTLDDLFGQEGYDSTLIRDGEGNLVEAGWQNSLDLIAQWTQALALDNTERAYFSALADTDNHASTSAELQVSGDYQELASRKISFYTGYPIQALSPDMDLSFYSDFTVTAVNPDGSIDVDYTYDDGGGPVVYSTTFPGTGEGNSIYLEPPEAGVQVYMVEATYYVGDTFGPVNNVFPEGTEPSASNPLTITYTFVDDNNQRQYHTLTMTGTGEANSVELGGMERFSEVISTASADSPTSAAGVRGNFQLWVYDGNSRWAVDVNNILATDTMDQIAGKINAAIDAARTADPTFPADYPAASVTQDQQLRILGSDTVDFTFSNQTNNVLTDLGFDTTFTLTLAQGSTLGSYDQFDLTLEQYGQGQVTSQEMLWRLEGMMSDLLNYSADAGSRLNRLDVRDTLLDDDYLRLNDRLEAFLDTRAEEAIVNLQTYETLYQATLKSTAMISSRTLADYL